MRVRAQYKRNASTVQHEPQRNTNAVLVWYRGSTSATQVQSQYINPTRAQYVQMQDTCARLLQHGVNNVTTRCGWMWVGVGAGVGAGMVWGGCGGGCGGAGVGARKNSSGPWSIPPRGGAGAAGTAGAPTRAERPSPSADCVDPGAKPNSVALQRRGGAHGWLQLMLPSTHMV